MYRHSQRSLILKKKQIFLKSFYKYKYTNIFSYYTANPNKIILSVRNMKINKIEFRIDKKS